METTSTHFMPNLPTEIWLKIFSYLPHGDLQQARLVCKRWAYLVNLPEFKQKSKLTVCRNTLNALVQNVQNGNYDLDNLNYPNLELQGLSCCNELQALLQHIGKHVRCLTLQNASVFLNMNGNLPNLEELSIREFYSIQDNVDELQAIKLSDFKKLKALDLVFSSQSRQMKAWVLRQLSWVGECTLKIEELQVEHTIEHEELLLNVLESHALTLKHLRLYLSSPPALSITKWQAVFARFRSMETIKIFGNCRHYEWLEVIFNSMPAEAKLKHIDLSGIMLVTDSLLRLIISKWRNFLEQLELMFCACITDVGVRELAQVRQTLHTLNLSHCRKITQRGILEGIAAQRNEQMRRLYLDDVDDLNEESICLLAQNMPNLVELSLENCRNAVTDKSLSWIFRHQTRLQNLALDDCVRITDDGILGNGDLNYSIKRLRGLQSLSLRGCRHISNISLKHGFQFKELRSLSLGYSHKISAVGGIDELVANCPTIENLTISSCPMLDDEAIFFIANGLQRLRKLNVSNCINITQRSFDYIFHNCETIKELTMCGIDTLQLNEAHFNRRAAFKLDNF